MTPVRAIVLDIEGTTTDLRFVHDTLFPLARAQLPAFVAAHGHEEPWRAHLDAVRATLVTPQRTLSAIADDEVVATLQRWIDEDRKDPHLKALQGGLWRAAYEGGLRAHVYDDVAPALARWRAKGLRLYVFSSGSVEAQRLLFAHSTAGDLSGCFDGHFDTQIGSKRAPDAYRAIAERLQLLPSQLMFLSDSEAELAAALDAGWRVIRVARPGTEPVKADNPTVRQLLAVDALLVADMV